MMCFLKKLFLCVAAWLVGAQMSANDFITVEEYGKMLYENPRSVGCNKCHGRRGEGKFIASYTNKKNEIVKFTAPPLRSLDYKRFRSGLKNHSPLVPKYFLTEDEAIAIYQFLKESR